MKSTGENKELLGPGGAQRAGRRVKIDWAKWGITEKSDTPAAAVRPQSTTKATPPPARQPTVVDLTPDQLERFGERAAIREFDGCQTHEEADAGALAETLAAQEELVSPGDQFSGEPTTFERWTQAQGAACWTKCKNCAQRIMWGETDRIFDYASPDGRPTANKRERWQKLDPDYVPHVCGAKRVVELTGQSEGMAQLDRETAARPIGLTDEEAAA